MTFRRAFLASLPAVLGLLLLVGCYATDGNDDARADGPLQGDAIPVVDVVADVPDDGSCDRAPDFTLTDLNPASPTYMEDRTLSDMVGKVVLIYFANYS